VRQPPIGSWWVAWGAALAAHAAVLPLPIVTRDSRQELEFVSFELAADLPPPPAPPAPPPEEEVPAPPGPKRDDPAADPDRTSLESNRPPDPEAPDEPVPLVTGVPLDAESLSPAGVGVRVGNTFAEGHDADVAPGDLKGFVGGGMGGGDGDTSVGVGKADREPELLRAWQPPYPDSMREAEISGRVLLAVHVGRTGRAEGVRVVEGIHPELDEVAVAAMARFRWAPARRGGQKVPATILIAIRFTLAD
jgi:periplasmic protein TonB